MKLVYISSSTLFSKSANSLHVMKMANSFSKTIDEVVLIVRDIQSEKNPFEYYNVDQNFKIKNFNVKKFSKLEPIVYSIKVIYEYLIKNKSRNKTIFFGRDILTLYLLSLFSRNVSIELHAIPTSIIKRKLLERLFKRNRINKTIVISEALKRDLIKFIGIHEENILVAHDGADIQKPSHNEDISKIGYIGSINQGRGIELIIELAEIYPRISFFIVGGTHSDLKEKLNIYNVPDNVICTGYLSQKEIKNLMNDFYIVLAPYQKKVSVSKKGSDTSKWMSPIKLFEYMSYGKAIIVSDIPVLHEVIINNYNGILVSPQSLSEWSSAVTQLLEDQSLHETLKINAYKTLVDGYTWDQRSVNIYKSIKE